MIETGVRYVIVDSEGKRYSEVQTPQAAEALLQEYRRRAYMNLNRRNKNRFMYNKSFHVKCYANGEEPR
jgi:hypothetical protein